jgi:hypothetical protein
MRAGFICRICKRVIGTDEMKYLCPKHGEIGKNCVTIASPLGKKRCKECAAIVTAYKHNDISGLWRKAE